MFQCETDFVIILLDLFNICFSVKQTMIVWLKIGKQILKKNRKNLKKILWKYKISIDIFENFKLYYQKRKRKT